MKNKKADISIVLLVIIAVILALAALTSFIYSTKKTDVKIVDARVIEALYLEEEQARFYLQDAGKLVLQKEYDKLPQDRKNNKQELADNFKNSFQNKISERTFDFDALTELKLAAGRVNFDCSVSADGNYLVLTVSDYSIKKDVVERTSSSKDIFSYLLVTFSKDEIEKNMGISYKTNLVVRFDLSELTA
jgi:Tfp pilus assembly protein PilE